MLTGSGNNELRFLFRRPGSHANEVCERDGRGSPGVGGLESGWSATVESPLSFACSSWSGRGSALVDAALGASNVNDCSPVRLPANFLNSSSGSPLPNRNVANLDLRFSTLFALSSPTLRSGAAFGLDLCRTKDRNLDRRRLSGWGAGSSGSSVGAVVMMAGAKSSSCYWHCQTKTNCKANLLVGTAGTGGTLWAACSRAFAESCGSDAFRNLSKVNRCVWALESLGGEGGEGVMSADILRSLLLASGLATSTDAGLLNASY
jgi:hypothetical protein